MLPFSQATLCLPAYAHTTPSSASPASAFRCFLTMPPSIIHFPCVPLSNSHSLSKPVRLPACPLPQLPALPHGCLHFFLQAWFCSPQNTLLPPSLAPTAAYLPVLPLPCSVGIPSSLHAWHTRTGQDRQTGKVDRLCFGTGWTVGVEVVTVPSLLVRLKPAPPDPIIPPICKHLGLLLPHHLLCLCPSTILVSSLHAFLHFCLCVPVQLWPFTLKLPTLTTNCFHMTEGKRHPRHLPLPLQRQNCTACPKQTPSSTTSYLPFYHARHFWHILGVPFAHDLLKTGMFLSQDRDSALCVPPSLRQAGRPGGWGLGQAGRGSDGQTDRQTLLSWFCFALWFLKHYLLPIWVSAMAWQQPSLPAHLLPTIPRLLSLLVCALQFLFVSFASHVFPLGRLLSLSSRYLHSSQPLPTTPSLPISAF